ncbi:phosphoesterase [Brevibacillus parabrevis]|uniref:metallophosphoesterase n=1 Tax=Brevibacillus parabrevis TaxID=54914 RepID=UPI0007AC2A22|nr:metallophosphoesterase [Brevibacillus parabrevis]KZE55362.1 phosphoesterase [Brevibacillus parabrevis]
MATSERKLVNDPKLVTVSRRTFLQRSMKWLGGLIGVGLAAGTYGYAWERTWLQIERMTLRLPRLPDAFDGRKLVQFSDVHLGHFFKPEQLQGIVDLIMREQPDIICFTGDIVDEETRPFFAAIPILAQLQAPMGKFAVMGNHDYRAGQQHGIRQGWVSAGFEVLDNRNVAIRQKTDILYIAGIDDALNGVPDLPKALIGIPEGSSVILLAHEPDVADEAGLYPIDLQLSGHSHGGQVRLPFVGHVLTPKLANKYVKGLYLASENKMQVYVNRGLGTTILPVRFLCRPELTVLTLHQ